MIDYSPGLVDRGAAITVTGTAFGTSCYDTGPPPAGEGVLGTPMTGISVVVVQGGSEVVVARGAADDEYEFAADIVIPPELEPGQARLEVRYDEDIAYLGPVDSALIVSEVPPLPASAPAVTRFGPEPEPGPTTASTVQTDGTEDARGPTDAGGARSGGGDLGWLVPTIAGIVLVLGASVSATWAARRRHR